VDTVSFYHLVDVLRLVERAGAFSSEDLDALRTWMDVYLEWLVSVYPHHERYHATRWHGFTWDVQVASLAMYRGRYHQAIGVLRKMPLRIMTTDPVPDSVSEAERIRSHYENGNRPVPSVEFCYTVNIVAVALRLCEHLNIVHEVWNAQSASGRSMARTFGWLLQMNEVTETHEPSHDTLLFASSKAGCTPISPHFPHLLLAY